MNKFCTNCGAPLNENDKFCTKCGFRIISEEKTPETKEQVTEQKTEPAASQPIQTNTKAPKKEKKKRRKGKGFLIFLAVVAGIAALLFLLWFAFGNMLTLSSHSKGVVASINSGNLNLDGAYSDYSSLPPYVQNMMGEEKTDGKNGALMTEMLPYIKAEVQKINGFFGASSVEYSISAPDMESFILSQDLSAFSSEEDLLSAMLSYIPTAPHRIQTVKVEYYKSSALSKKWRGNYATSEFADAISGGMNSAYTKLYLEMLEEMGATAE